MFVQSAPKRWGDFYTKNPPIFQVFFSSSNELLATVLFIFALTFSREQVVISTETVHAFFAFGFCIPVPAYGRIGVPLHTPAGSPLARAGALPLGSGRQLVLNHRTHVPAPAQRVRVGWGTRTALFIRTTAPSLTCRSPGLYSERARHSPQNHICALVATRRPHLHLRVCATGRRTVFIHSLFQSV